MYVPSGDGTGMSTHLSLGDSMVILIGYPVYAGAVDIGAVVCEIGAYAARLGFAGEDQPRSYFPSVSLLTPLWCLDTGTLKGCSHSHILMHVPVSACLVMPGAPACGGVGG